MFDDTYYGYYTKGPYTIQNIDQDPTLSAYTLHLAILLHPPTTPRPILWREMLTWPVEYFGPMEGMGKVFQRWGFFRSRNGESPNMRILGSMWTTAKSTVEWVKINQLRTWGGRIDSQGSISTFFVRCAYGPFEASSFAVGPCSSLLRQTVKQLRFQIIW